MADAVPASGSGPNSTPTESTAPVAAEATPTAAAAPATSPTSSPNETPTSATVSPETQAKTQASQEATPASEAPPAPLFKLPEDIKLAPDATTKFEAFLRPKLGADGKLNLTAQEVMDHFATQARDTMARWQAQIEAKSQANEAACKQRFSAAQLGAAQTAVGFLSSFDPTFRELSQRQLNDPAFVNAMRIIGERLSEDSLEVDGHVPAPKGPVKSAAERMGYVKAKTN